MSLESGSDGRARPVLGIVQDKSEEDEESDGSRDGSIPSNVTFSSSSFSMVPGSASRTGNGGLTKGLEFVSRRRSNRHIALINSRNTTTRQRTFGPLRRATISQRSSVYWMVWRVRAMRW